MIDTAPVESRERHTGNTLATLGMLDFNYPHQARKNGRSNGSQPSSAAIVPEEYARLHADIEMASNPARCFVVGVTSSVYGEGKTTVALNLAGTMAQNSDARVALVDFNLRNWDMQTRVNLPASAGLVDLLEGAENDLVNVAQATEFANLTIIPAGRAAANPARLVRSARLQEVMAAVKRDHDFVILDMAPILPVADTKTMAKLIDGVVMVVRAGVTPREIVTRAIESVGRDKVLGIVLNGVETAMPAWLQRYFS